MTPSAEQVEEVLRFARKLEMHSDHEQLFRALPAELCVLLDCSTTALIHWHEGQLTAHVVDSANVVDTDGCALVTDHLARTGDLPMGRLATGRSRFGKRSPIRKGRSFFPALDRPSTNRDFPRRSSFFANAAINLFACFH